MELETAHIIRDLVAPAVMISAAGLLILSTNARLMSILSQVRSLHHERADYLARSSEGDRTAQHVRTIRLDGLRAQTSGMLRSARWMRFTLASLFLSVLLMIACSGCIGAASFSTDFYPGAVVCFGLGALAFAAGMIASIVEISSVLGPVTFEHGRVGSLSAGSEPTEVIS